MAARTAGRAHCRPCHLCLPAPTLRAATDNSGYSSCPAARRPRRDCQQRYSNEQLFDHEDDAPLRSKSSRHRVKRAPEGAPAPAWPALSGSAASVSAAGPPDDLDVLAVRERLVDRTAAEQCEHVILGNALGVGLAELSAHPFPEGSQAHAGQATRPRGCLEHGAAPAPRLIPTGTQVARRRVLAVN